MHITVTQWHRLNVHCPRKLRKPMSKNEIYVYLHVLQGEGEEVYLNNTNISLWMSTVLSGKLVLIKY